MALTKDDLAILIGMFDLNEHELLRGYVYITEEAITRRLDEVDPSWEFQRLEVWTSGEQVCASGRLTVCGVSRDGIGMQKLGIGEPEKGAITDALKRCARLFGVGRYILDMGNMKDMKEIGEWLKKNAPNKSPQPLSSVGNSQPATTTPQTPQNAPIKAVVKEFQVNLDKKNNPYLIFSFGDKQSVAVYSGEKFRGAGYATDGWKTKGYHELTPPAELTLVKDGKFWALDSVKMLDVFEEAS